MCSPILVLHWSVSRWVASLPLCFRNVLDRRSTRKPRPMLRFRLGLACLVRIPPCLCHLCAVADPVAVAFAFALSHSLSSGVGVCRAIQRRPVNMRLLKRHILISAAAALADHRTCCSLTHNRPCNQATHPRVPPQAAPYLN